MRRIALTRRGYSGVMVDIEGWWRMLSGCCRICGRTGGTARRGEEDALYPRSVQVNVQVTPQPHSGYQTQPNAQNGSCILYKDQDDEWMGIFISGDDLLPGEGEQGTVYADHARTESGRGARHFFCSARITWNTDEIYSVQDQEAYFPRCLGS